MNFFKKTLAVIVLSLIAFGAVARADDTDKKIASIDLRRCLMESQKGKKLKDEFEAKVTKLDAKGQGLEKEAKDLLRDLEKQASLLTDAVKKEKQERLFAIRDEMKNLDTQKRGINDDLVAQAMKEIAGIVKNLAEIRGYTLVLNDAGPWLVYASPKVDITAEVIQIYDKATEK